MFVNEELRNERVGNLNKIMANSDLDALLLTDLSNVRYATDMRPIHSIFYVNAYVAIVFPRRKPILFSSEADRHFVTSKLPWLEWRELPSFVPRGAVEEAWVRIIANELTTNVHRVGYDELSAGLFRGLSTALEAELVPVGKEILMTRAIKSELEIDVMEKAVQFAEIGMDAVRRAVQPGVAEFKLAAEAIYAMKLAGAEAESHMPAIRSGDNAGLLQRVDSERVLVPGDTVIADLGARYLGYSAEYCRTFSVGRPNKELRRAYKVLMDAYQEAIDLVRPGMETCHIDRFIRQRLIAAGYPDYPHATGHGIGMSNAEFPPINKSSEIPLKTGMVICLEPGIYLPGIGGVKEEDILLIEEDGARVLTKTPYDAALLNKKED